MPNIKSLKEIEMEKRLDILGQALQQVCRERKEATELADEWEDTANYFFNRYNAKREEFVKHLLSLNKSKPKMPDITLSDDDLSVI